MFLKLFRWFCGSLLLLLGCLTWVNASPVGGGLFLAAGLLILPPTFPWLAQVTNIQLQRSHKWLAVVILCNAGIGALATGLETTQPTTPQALAAERSTRHVEDSLGLTEAPARLGTYRAYPNRTRWGRRRRPYYPSRSYGSRSTSPTPAPQATGLRPSPRIYTYRSHSPASAGPAPSKPLSASQPYSAPRVFTYRASRQSSSSSFSQPQPAKLSHYSWKRSSKK